MKKVLSTLMISGLGVSGTCFCMGPILDSAKSKIDYAAQEIKAKAGQAAQGIKSGTNYAAQGLKTKAGQAAQGIKSGTNYVAQGLKAKAGQAAQGIKSGVSYAAQGITAEAGYIAEKVKSDVNFAIRSIKRNPKVRKINRKVGNFVRDPDIKLAAGASALVGGAVASYYAVPGIIKSLSRYFGTEEGSVISDVSESVINNVSKLVDAGKTVASNPGNWAKISDGVAKYGPYATAGAGLLSAVALPLYLTSDKHKVRSIVREQKKINNLLDKIKNEKDTLDLDQYKNDLDSVAFLSGNVRGKIKSLKNDDNAKSFLKEQEALDKEFVEVYYNRELRLCEKWHNEGSLDDEARQSKAVNMVKYWKSVKNCPCANRVKKIKENIPWLSAEAIVNYDEMYENQDPAKRMAFINRVKSISQQQKEIESSLKDLETREILDLDKLKKLQDQITLINGEFGKFINQEGEELLKGFEGNQTNLSNRFQTLNEKVFNEYNSAAQLIQEKQKGLDEVLDRTFSNSKLDESGIQNLSKEYNETMKETKSGIAKLSEQYAGEQLNKLENKQTSLSNKWSNLQTEIAKRNFEGSVSSIGQNQEGAETSLKRFLIDEIPTANVNKVYSFLQEKKNEIKSIEESINIVKRECDDDEGHKEEISLLDEKQKILSNQIQELKKKAAEKLEDKVKSISTEQKNVKSFLEDLSRKLLELDDTELNTSLKKYQNQVELLGKEIDKVKGINQDDVSDSGVKDFGSKVEGFKKDQVVLSEDLKKLERGIAAKEGFVAAVSSIEQKQVEIEKKLNETKVNELTFDNVDNFPEEKEIESLEESMDNVKRLYGEEDLFKQKVDELEKKEKSLLQLRKNAFSVLKGLISKEQKDWEKTLSGALNNAELKNASSESIEKQSKDLGNDHKNAMSSIRVNIDKLKGLFPGEKFDDLEDKQAVLSGKKFDRQKEFEKLKKEAEEQEEREKLAQLQEFKDEFEKISNSEVKNVDDIISRLKELTEKNSLQELTEKNSLQSKVEEFKLANPDLKKDCETLINKINEEKEKLVNEGEKRIKAQFSDESKRQDLKILKNMASQAREIVSYYPKEKEKELKDLKDLLAGINKQIFEIDSGVSKQPQQDSLNMKQDGLLNQVQKLERDLDNILDNEVKDMNDVILKLEELKGESGLRLKIKEFKSDDSDSKKKYREFVNTIDNEIKSLIAEVNQAEEVDQAEEVNEAEKVNQAEEVNQAEKVTDFDPKKKIQWKLFDINSQILKFNIYEVLKLELPQQNSSNMNQDDSSNQVHESNINIGEAYKNDSQILKSDVSGKLENGPMQPYTLYPNGSSRRRSQSVTGFFKRSSKKAKGLFKRNSSKDSLSEDLSRGSLEGPIKKGLSKLIDVSKSLLPHSKSSDDLNKIKNN